MNSNDESLMDDLARVLDAVDGPEATIRKLSTT